MMFIVDPSGSGKSAIAQLLLRIYDPREDAVRLDEMNARFLDEGWTKGHVAGGGQQGASGVVVAIGTRLLDGEGERGDVGGNVLMHGFIRDLSLGYEIILVEVSPLISWLKMETTLGT